MKKFILFAVCLFDLMNHILSFDVFLFHLQAHVTSQFPLTYNGNSFTVQFDNIKGEGYLIKYDVKLSYTPVNQEGRATP